MGAECRKCGADVFDECEFCKLEERAVRAESERDKAIEERGVLRPDGEFVAHNPERKAVG